MKFANLSLSFLTIAIIVCDRINRQVLNYAAIPDGLYVIPKNSTTVTLLDLIKSRDDLTALAEVLEKCNGFSQAFDTTPQWTYTFLAPSNTAFNSTGEYFNTFVATPKGKWWLGNLIQHHYIPNSRLKSSAFNSSYTRIQTGSFLYIGTQVVERQLMLNNVSVVTTADIPVTNGLVHIIDRILDPSAQVFEPDVEKTSQGFIAGSCSNSLLPYC